MEELDYNCNRIKEQKLKLENKIEEFSLKGNSRIIPEFNLELMKLDFSLCRTYEDLLEKSKKHNR